MHNSIHATLISYKTKVPHPNLTELCIGEEPPTGLSGAIDTTRGSSLHLLTITQTIAHVMHRPIILGADQEGVEDTTSLSAGAPRWLQAVEGRLGELGL